MAGTLTVDTIQTGSAGLPPAFKDSGGTEVGQLCRAWVNFNGVTSPSVRASFNVSSVTRNGSGDYTINFTNALPDLNYVAVAIGGAPAGGGTTNGIYATEMLNTGPTYYRTSSAYRFLTISGSGSNADCWSGNVAIFR